MPSSIELSRYARLPLRLLVVLGLVCLGTGIAPAAGRVSWLLEVAPGLLGVLVLVATYHRFPMSHLVYALVLVHFCILAYGGFYTYERTPLGNWARDVFHLARNHYDRVGHFALGAFPALTIREVLLRKTPLERGGWLTFLILAVVLAIAAFWELIEWWVTLLTASDVGQAFLGTQGDVWDAQWDMLWALIGAGVSLPILSRAHDRAMQKVPGTSPGT
jgi:putative membrane protein